MKNILIWIINIYQKVPGPWHGYCKHIPTCSEYMKIAINRYGVLKGLILGIKRILRCNPFSKAGYDPVPERNVKNEK